MKLHNQRWLPVALASALSTSASAATQIDETAFAGSQIVESFEGLTTGPNAAPGPTPAVISPGVVEPFDFGSGVVMTFPIPNTNGLEPVWNLDFARLGFTQELGTNGSIGLASQLPDGTAYMTLPYENAAIEFTFDEVQVRVAVAVTGRGGDGPITMEAFDELGNSLGVAVVSDVHINDWPSNFIGLEDIAGIKRIRIERTFLVLDALTFERPDGSWDELLDAGQNGVERAQLPHGPGLLEEIRGTIESPNDVDLYCIRIENTNTFSASTIGATGVDTTLYLFDIKGNGVAFNDDSGSPQSMIDASLVDSEGVYFLAVSGFRGGGFNFGPNDEKGQPIFDQGLFTGVNPPFECGGPFRPDCNRFSGRLESWGPTPELGNGAYSVLLTGAAFCASRVATTLHVPESFPTIQAAIDASVDGDTIQVGPGTYLESVLIQDKSVSLRSTHGPRETTIDGNGVEAFAVRGDVGPRSLIEGFTFVESTGGLPQFGLQTLVSSGAAPTIRNCVYPEQQTENSVRVELGAGPVFDRCSFTRGLMFEKIRVEESAAARFTSCLLAQNMDSVSLLVLFDSFAELLGCTVAANQSDVTVEAMLGGAVSGANNVFSGNTGIEFNGLDPNVAFTNSLVTGGAGTNLDADPMFLDPNDGDFRLGAGSPAIDAGDCTLVPPDSTIHDLAGDDRIMDAVSILDTGPACAPLGVIDLGCYEASPGAARDCPGDADGSGAVDFGDVTTVLSNWLAVCP